MNTEEKLNQYVLHSYGRYPMAAVRGEGSRLWDSTGKCYLDFCAGIATCVLGHCHPVVTQALQKQAATLVHCSNLYQIPQQADLAEFIVTKCVERPGKVFFANSGAESNDGLIKVARRYGHRKPQPDGKPRYEVLTFNKSFHGRTLGSMSATGQDKIKIGFDPMLPGFRHLPFNDLETAREAIRPETVAFMLETVQGEGGVNCVTPEFLRGLAQLCREHDLLLLMDEVQCGFGRCGDIMGWRAVAPDVEPDGISWAKALGGGFPIGGFWISDRAIDGQGTELSSIMDPGSHGSTYGGNPLGTAVGLAVLREVVSQGLPERARRLGAEIRREIESWNLPVVQGVRGLGLLLGIGLNPEMVAAPEGKTIASVVVEALRQELGLDRPFLERYVSWLGDFVRGDMGSSYNYSMPVSQMLQGKIPVTGLLTLLSFLLIVVLSIPLGLFTARHSGGALDKALTVVNQVLMAVPAFFTGILLTYLFGLLLRWFVPGSFVSPAENFWQSAGYLVFPAAAIAIPRIAMTVKMLRSALLAEMNKDYVRTSYSRGNDRRATLYLHVLRNALPPVVSFLAMTVADIVAGSVVIEQVFAIPGLGRLLLTSISNRDYPVVQAVVVLVAFWVVLVNLLGDLLNQRLDPRLRLTD